MLDGERADRAMASSATSAYLFNVGNSDASLIVHVDNITA